MTTCPVEALRSASLKGAVRVARVGGGATPGNMFRFNQNIPPAG